MTRVRDAGIKQVGKKGKTARYGIYICPDCNRETEVRDGHVRSGNTKRCSDCGKKLRTKHLDSHSMSRSRIYKTYYNMRTRCTNPKSRKYHLYGGKGIIVCDEWMQGFERFQEWANANGYSDDLTIDRIDSSGNYEPNNCRFISLSENSSRAASRSNMLNNSTIKISIDEASEICEAYATGNFTMLEIANSLNVRKQTIFQIIKGQS